MSTENLAQDTQEVNEFLQDFNEAFQNYKEYIERAEQLRGQKSKTKKGENQVLDDLLKSYESLVQKSKNIEDVKLKQQTEKEIIRLQESINSYRVSDIFKQNTKINKKRRDSFDKIKSEETQGIVEDIENLEKDIEKLEKDIKQDEVEEMKEGEVEEMKEGEVEEMKQDEMKQDEKEEMKQEEKEEMKQEEKEEIKQEEMKAEEPIIDKEMEEIHNQIRKEEREKTLKEFRIGEFSEEDKIQIPKERLGVVGKTIAILNDDIKYFIKRFPDILKTEADVYKKANKRNKKLLLDIHKRIQAKLSNSTGNDTQGKRIGIVLDADSYIDSKINELLASKTLEGLTPANLVDITKAPISKGKDLGSYTVIKQGGVDYIENAPIYRAIPSSNEEQAIKEEEGGKGKIDQATIYKNSGKTKVDIAKMELRNNPFIKTRKPTRLDIIL